MKQFTMYVLFAICAVSMALVSIFLISDNHPLEAFLIPVVGSLFGLRLIRWDVERDQPGDVLNPHVQSWSFLFGDSIALPLAFVFVTKAWNELDTGGFFWSWSWLGLAFGIGLLMGIAFHWMDGKYYEEAGASAALVSPSKIWHDLVVYPVLGGSLVWAGVPVLAHSWTVWTVSSLLAVAAWLVLGVIDGKRGLQPLDLHPRWDPKQFSPI